MASDQLTVKLIKVSDKTIVSLEDHIKPAKHVTWHFKGRYLAVSCTDGVIYIYKASDEKWALLTKIDGVVPSVETNSEVSSRIVWHPDGTAFAAPTATREVKLVSAGDWKEAGVFKDGHTGDITAIAWSPNGAFLVSAGRDRKVLLWNSETQEVVARYDYPRVMDIAWHPRNNIVSFTTGEGEVYIHNDFVPEEYAAALDLPLAKAPIDKSGAAGLGQKPRILERPVAQKITLPQRPAPASDGLDDIITGTGLDLGHDSDDVMVVDDDDDGFVEDDDGAGYTVARNINGKRPSDYLDVGDDASGYKRHAIQAIWQPQKHEAFQPGSTPWAEDRRYLCINFIGSVWTVNQETHHTITVDFYDQSLYRRFHFTDTFLYDKACLSEHGALFSAQPRDDQDATLFYRPHEMWTERNDWRTTLPKGEKITAISLSDSYITVLTSAGFVRVFTLFLTPYRVYRQKSSPAVTCASWRDYVLTMGNGPVGADGHTTLLYSIDDVKRDETCQSEDVVALPPGVTLKSVFFSDVGDPCIYDSTGTLLTLLHWRIPSQARWVPLLDTTQLTRLANGRKTESYWPVAVADGKFKCIILKGGDRYPHFPVPLLHEFVFKIPIGSRGDEEDDETTLDPPLTSEEKVHRLEEKYLRRNILASLLSDTMGATRTTRAQEEEHGKLVNDADKFLLALFSNECMKGEEYGMRAVELVGMMRNSERLIPIAMKVAQRYERPMLEEKLKELGEKKMMEEAGEQDEGGMDY